ncbi:mannose-1-phosphate guanylyltransferase [Brevibacterium litoralis]|uniref:mannose-1-phosphate guanylyltransferase n=1 Tax=Brevibacterium litoralis TaxID=3138935 RepID=UPI0032F015D5
MASSVHVGSIPDFYAVVPAGGIGSRLWPVSRADTPKFLHDLTGSGRTLLQATVDRLEPLAGAAGIAVVTGDHHVAAVREQVPDVTADMVLAEPSPKESMAAIGLAAAVLQKRHGDVVIGSFAADQIITGTRAFEQAVHESVAVARAGYIATIGIAASRPSTAFGYIRSNGHLGVEGAPNALHAVAFTEKPDAATAQSYLATGEYRWNAGIFVSRTGVLLDHLAEQCPELAAGLDRIAQVWDTAEKDSVLAETWPGLQKIAIDHAVAEPVAEAGGVAVVPGTFGWDDVGDFNSLAGLLSAVGETGDKVVGNEEQVVRMDTGGNVVFPSGKRLITLLGVNDLVVVDTPGALMVTTRSRAQQVKNLVERLGKDGHTEVL